MPKAEPSAGGPPGLGAGKWAGVLTMPTLRVQANLSLSLSAASLFQFSFCLLKWV